MLRSYAVGLGCRSTIRRERSMDIGGIFGGPRPQSVNGAIQNAATATGASFEYLLAAAQAESGLNPQAVSPTSSARGLYQFIDQTWLATVKRAGPTLGYGKYADAIVQDGSGHFEVPNPIMRRDIMALRFDPTANAAMAGAYTRGNAAALAEGLGRKASDGELYIAHVLGAAGAVKLTSLAVSNPSAPADAAFPAAADANRTIFYDRLGRPRSVLDVYGALIGRYDGARSPTASSFKPDQSNRAAAETARATGASTAAAVSVGAPLNIVPGMPATEPRSSPDVVAGFNTGQKSALLFSDLFSDRSEPVSRGVQELWAPLVASSGGAAAPSRAASLVSSGGAEQPFPPRSTDGSGLVGWMNVSRGRVRGQDAPAAPIAILSPQ